MPWIQLVKISARPRGSETRQSASWDIDLLLPSTDEVGERMAALGFERRTGRHWLFPDAGVALEMPGDFLSERERAVEVRLPSGGQALVLSLEDILVRRMHEFSATGHLESTRQAIALMAVDDLDRERLDERVRQEGLEDALAVVEDLHARAERGGTIEADALHELARSLPRHRRGV